MIKKILLSLFVLVLVSLGLIYYQGNRFLATYNLSYAKLYSLAQEVANRPISNQPLNILLLGLDPRNDFLEKSNTTDTIILVHYFPPHNTIQLVSVPRDTWLPDNKIKINKLYEQTLNNPTKKIDLKSEFAQILGQPINNLFILSTQDVVNLLQITGPVEISLDYDLTDPTYPNPEYIKNKTGSIYKTIYFPKGKNQITTDNVLPYIRSRKGSDDPKIGTDLGRSLRQQELIRSLASQIPAKVKQDPTLIFKLYQFYNLLNTDIPLSQLLSLANYALSVSPKLQIQTILLPIDTKTGAVLYHPDYLVEKQWVFLPTQKNFQLLQEFLNKNLSHEIPQ